MLISFQVSQHLVLSYYLHINLYFKLSSTESSKHTCIIVTCLCGDHVLPDPAVVPLGLLLVKAIIFGIHIHCFYVAAIGKCFYKDRLAKGDGKLQLIKTLEKIHLRMINVVFLLAGSLNACHLPFICLPHRGFLLD